MKLTHASLFSGIGGIDLAAEAAGFQTCAQVEVNPFVNPSSASDSLMQNSSETSEKSGGGDILKACGGSPTVLSGGFPCQPVSLAGKQLGSKDERWLWPEYYRLIRETRPSWVVAENVAALTSLPEFRDICKDLESEGYEIRVLHLRATDVGAPHVRKRCFVVSHSDCKRLQEGESIPDRLQEEITRASGIRSHVANPDNLAGLQTNSPAHKNRTEHRSTSRQSTTRWIGRINALPDWKKNPSRICRMDDGFSRGVDKSRLQALGNAVVPRCAYPIFDAIRRIEQEEY